MSLQFGILKLAEAVKQAERERDEARGKWGVARERLEQAVALLREWRDDDGLPAATHTSKRGRTDALLASQPAPVKPVVDDANRTRNSMRAALVAALEGQT